MKNKEIKLPEKKKIELDIICLSQIGNKIKITNSKNKNQIGIEGTLMAETAKFFILDMNGTEKRIFKNNVEIQLEINKKTILANGKIFDGTLVTRIKKIK